MKPNPSPLKGTEVLVNPEALGWGRPPSLGRRDLLHETHQTRAMGLYGKSRNILSSPLMENSLISYRELVQRRIILKNQMVPLFPMAAYKSSIFLSCGTEID